MARLTTFSKLLITILILLALVFGFNYLTEGKLLGGILGGGDTRTEASTGNNGTTSTGTTSTTGNSGSSGDPIRVGVVTWGGYAGGQY